MAKITFVDRQAAKPNRFLIAPESGDAYYATLARADEPLVEGTAINAAALNSLGEQLRNTEISTASEDGLIYISGGFEELSMLVLEMLTDHMEAHDVMMVDIQCEFYPLYAAGLLTVHKGVDSDMAPSATATLVTSTGDKLFTHGYDDGGGAWDIEDWAWENPPMWADTEYRTTERFNGRPVYCKLVDCGLLPDNDSKSVAHGVSNMGILVRFEGRIGTYGFPFEYSNGAFMKVASVNGTNITIKTNQAFESSDTVYVTLYYTKA